MVVRKYLQPASVDSKHTSVLKKNCQTSCLGRYVRRSSVTLSGIFRVCQEEWWMMLYRKALSSNQCIKYSAQWMFTFRWPQKSKLRRIVPRPISGSQVSCFWICCTGDRSYKCSSHVATSTASRRSWTLAGKLNHPARLADKRLKNLAKEYLLTWENIKHSTQKADYPLWWP